MKQHDLIHITREGLSARFTVSFPELVSSARGDDLHSFKLLIRGMASSRQDLDAANTILEFLQMDGKTVHELSTETPVKIETVTLLFDFLGGRLPEDSDIDAITDFYHQLSLLLEVKTETPDKETVEAWMNRWPSGLDSEVNRCREDNKARIQQHLIEKLSSHRSTQSKYSFPEGTSQEEKLALIRQWWGDFRFHINQAARTPDEVATFLGGTICNENCRSLLKHAEAKGMPFFLTPYYASLLDETQKDFDDYSLRSYVLYSQELVDSFGSIRAWEKEDITKAGEPNAAGWIVPYPKNIHRRYPDVAILIPDTLGRSCGGLCASCQRMYDFQNEHLKFEFQELAPSDSWPWKLRRLMDYFENDTQIRDILITGGDALMSRNESLRLILRAVISMADRKRKANLSRKDGEKFAEIQRIRLGTRLPVYLPMRIDGELIEILREAKEEGIKAGISQFIVQTHFQTSLEITKESAEALRLILSSGWRISNQLVYNVASSRRGHTAKLRKILEEHGVDCYYTFTVKGFEENRAVYTPNCRSLQESMEEKIWNKTTGRNVLNLPAIGKSMTFQVVGINHDGRRILRFDHDRTRPHSPIINRIKKVYILENKSVAAYLRQLESVGEDVEEYASIWTYTRGQTEKRAPIFDYPDFPFRTTTRLTNYKDNLDKTER
jgi:lysine 2,3-aminomutase